MDISESIDAILQTNDIVSGQFYHRFFEECPHLAEFFKGKNMSHQATMLTSAMVLVEMYHRTDAVGLSPYLQLLGKRHDEMGIRPEHFDEWAQSMLGTLKEFHGDDWNDQLASQWQDAIQKAVTTMLDGYGSETNN